MDCINIEIKAKSNNYGKIKQILKLKKANYCGTDHQIDTYFQVSNGRLKFREGNIENYLIHYAREDKKEPKQSKVTLFKTPTDSSLKEVLSKGLKKLVVVDKQREIYFIDNVKFHIDKVKGLGSFVEIEATDKDGSIGKDQLLKQCRQYMELFGIKKADLVSCSYCDLLLNKKP